eukprot:TRINITY_DN1067_c0_g1_i1.p1 TRINITY_DN1067_c0_g1~~TRINITY_DN1067_c0_g1_i1.p1  ORF type:complete len:311 (+),score=75.86 TRINITY_DN1067_c0_g1_i1:87-1019(+)
MATIPALQSLLESGYNNATLLAQNVSAPAVQNFLASADPLIAATVLMLVISLVCFVLSIVTSNVSIVDMLWSVIPPIYALLFLYYQPNNPRMQLSAGLVCLWGLRLSVNLALKGGYSLAFEDYRWAYVKGLVHPVIFLPFNLTFIALYQNLLLLLIVCPLYLVYLRPDVQLNEVDVVAGAATFFFILIETIADWQMRQFRLKKYSASPKQTKPRGNFITSGLFYYSRHPNFFAEMSIWWSVYMFSVAAKAEALNWTAVGAFLLTLLFQGSTTLTEYMAVKKYPEYALYQQTTSRLIPWFPSSSPADKKSK